ncbi:decaprenyl-phosphate phosphoribosyltransferase [Roseivirga sp. BDSF3-8]|uniref:decaprenyl-phosphate phosphoribosyltransferase n=1 Tax=Roseivirga sp. BDSF3-8 TaxID=3241598 RepID=UPI0035321CB1
MLNTVEAEKGSLMSQTATLLRLIRVKHWVKNTFLFIPAFFAGTLFRAEGLLQLIAGFFAFSFIASAVYIMNDYRDIESDRQHPVKSKRPLASGAVSPRAGLSYMSILLVTGLAIGLILSPYFLAFLGVYFVMNIAYSMGLKNISILDIFIIALGFLLRTVSGGILAEVPISQWLIIMVFLLAVFLGLAKRRDDLVLAEQEGKVLRKASEKYNLVYVNNCLTMLAAVIVVAYLMYCLSDEVIQRFESPYLFYTSVFVIAGMMRYLQITLVEQNSGSPTKVLYKDAFIRITLLLWILAFMVLIYANKLF